MASANPDSMSVNDMIISYGNTPINRVFTMIVRFFNHVTIEPVVFLYSLGFSITMVISPNLYFEKTCKVGSVVFGDGSVYNESICDNIDNGEYNDTQAYVQKTVSSINLVTMFVKGIPPIIFALFIGPWSDRFGRKFLIVFPLVGYVLYDAWFLVNVLFFDFFKVEFLMLEVIQFWFGGFMCLFLGLYSYISDISTEKERTVRIAIVDFVFFTGMAIGSGISGKLFTTVGYIPIYAAAGVLQVLAISYALVFVKESRHIRAAKGMDIRNDVSVNNMSDSVSTSKSTSSGDSSSSSSSEEEEAPSGGCCSVFSFHHIKQSFTVAFKERPGGVRHVVIILILLFGLYTFANNGISAINITYARAKFKWNNTDDFNEWWAQYQSIGTVFNLFAIGVVMPIMTQVLHLRDLAITIICVMSSLAGITTILLAKIAEVLYLANCLRMFSDVVTVGIRSALTKIVGGHDVGKVFACVGAIQAIVALLSPIYNLIYIATYEWHIGFVYCVSCTVLSIMLSLSFYCYFFMRKYEKMKKENRWTNNPDDMGKDVSDGPAIIFQPSYKKKPDNSFITTAT